MAVAGLRSFQTIRRAWPRVSSRMACFSGARSRRVHERVLRYPDGKERVLRYSVESTVEEEDEDCFMGWDVSGGVAVMGSDRSKHLVKTASGVGQQVHAPLPSFQDTAAFLESLFAASYETQPAVDVDHCYEVLQGCPWLLPRPVFVLAIQGKSPALDDDIRSTYTLRTKILQAGASNALAQLLNKQHLADTLEVAEMRDGLVMFEAAGDADRYASMLEEEGHSQVLVAEVDSHRAFRLASDLKAVVVLLRDGTDVPPPYQLAASLKQKKSLDSM